MNSLITILTLIACLIITLNILLYIFFKKVKKIYILINIMDFKQLMVNTTIAITIGLIIQKIQTNTMKTFLDSYYFIISYLFIGIAILFVIEMFFYKNSRVKILITYANRLTYLMYTLILTLFAINPLLYINQIFCSILWLILFYICKFFNDINYKSNDSFSEINEEPINDRSKLYKQRYTELKQLESYLQDNSKNSNCTIAICANWGEGKTSFVNALKKGHEHKKDYVIFIQPMIMDSRKSLIDYFFSQMKFIMEKNSIYTGKGSPIDKYLNSLISIINKDNKKMFDNLLNMDNSQQNDYRELKKNLQNDIDNLLNKKSNNKSIKILIDDFDRVEKSVMYQILAFIKEVASFRGCTVIFLMNSSEIRNLIPYEYLDKFISKTFEFKKIDREEIIEYYLDNKIYFNYEDENNEIIKDQYIYFSQNILEELDKIEKQIEKVKIELKQNQKKDELNIVETYISTYKDLSSNPRRLKKLFLEVQDVCKLIYRKYSHDTVDNIRSQYNLVNCNEIILKMSILKILFEKEYYNLLYTLDIEKYMKVTNSPNIVKMLFEKEVEKFSLEIEVKTQSSIYSFINKNFLRSHSTLESVTEIKTKNKQILEELDKSKVFEQDTTFDILDILEAIFCDKSDLKILETRLNKLEKLLENRIDSGTIKFNDVLEMLLIYDGRFHYSESTKQLCQVLKQLIFKLFEKQYTFNSPNEKQYITRLSKELEKDIVSRHSTCILSSLKISLNKFNIASTTLNLNSIKSINEYAIGLLEIKQDINGLTEIEILDRWVNKCLYIFKNNNNIDEVYKNRVKFIYEDALNFVNSIKLIDILKKRIESAEIKMPSYYLYDIPSNLEDLQNLILLLKENLSNYSEITDIKSLYNIFNDISSEIYNDVFALNNCIDKECIKNLDYIYKKLDKQYKKEYFNIIRWNYCAMKIMAIKSMSKNGA